METLRSTSYVPTYIVLCVDRLSSLPRYVGDGVSTIEKFLSNGRVLICCVQVLMMPCLSMKSMMSLADYIITTLIVVVQSRYQGFRVSYLDWEPLAIDYSDRHPVKKADTYKTKKRKYKIDDDKIYIKRLQ